MTVSLVDVASSATGTINVPTGTVSGDVMVAHAKDGATPVGWTQIYSYPGVFGDAKNIVAYRVAGGSEPASYTFGGIEGFVVTLRGIDNSTPFDTYALNAYGTPAADIYAPTVTPSAASILLLIWTRDSLTYVEPPTPSGTTLVYAGGPANAELKMVYPSLPAGGGWVIGSIGIGVTGGGASSDFKVFAGGSPTGDVFWTHAIASSGIRTVATVAMRPA